MMYLYQKKHYLTDPETYSTPPIDERTSIDSYLQHRRSQQQYLASLSSSSKKEALTFLAPSLRYLQKIDRYVRQFELYKQLNGRFYEYEQHVVIVQQLIEFAYALVTVFKQTHHFQYLSTLLKVGDILFNLSAEQLTDPQQQHCHSLITLEIDLVQIAQGLIE